VVDNAIVVIEAIYSHLSHERRVKKAVQDALKEVGPAVTASTLTTLAVFLPIIFVPGLAGQVFRDLSLTVIFTLIFSLLVAFTLIPMLIYKILGTELFVFKLLNLLLKPVELVVAPIGKGLGGVYRTVITPLSAKASLRLLLIVAVVIGFVASLGLQPPTEFFPETAQENYRIVIVPPAGQTLSETNRAVTEVETKVGKVAHVKSFSTRVAPDEAVVLVKLESATHGPAVMREFRQVLKLTPGIREYEVSSVSPLDALEAGEKGDVVVKIGGADLDVLADLAGKVEDAIRAVPGVGALANSVGEGGREFHVVIRRTEAGERGLTVRDIADQVEAALAGREATKVSLAERLDGYVVRLPGGVRREGVSLSGERSIVLSLPIGEVRSEEQLKSLGIQTPAGDKVALRSVADVVVRRGPTQIIREERQRIVHVSVEKEADVALGTLIGSLSNAGGTGRLDRDRFALPDGYELSLGGSGKEMQESFRYLKYALAMAILLVYMVMASQFESLLHPFVIMFSVPISLIGAFLALYLGKANLSLTGFIGIIMLAGIVVNNAIILIDYINILRARGMNRGDAVVQAGMTRLRPIFMTTLTTVLGMAPMALGLGAGAELYRPLALVVIGGLLFSTVLTLVFIPAVYCVLDDFADLLGLIRFRIAALFGK